jgi:hypothetical protein
MVLGALTLAACSRSAPPPRPPQASPSFESRVTEDDALPALRSEPGRPAPGAQGMEPGTESDATPPEPQPNGAGSSGANGALPKPSTPMGNEPAPGDRAPGAMSAPLSERGVCAALSQDAILRIEDVQGGVAIVMTPRAGADLDAVRLDAHAVEKAASPAAAQKGEQPSGERCELLEIGRQAGTTSMVEGPGEIRILMTSPDAATTRTVRQRAHDYVKGMEH